jgi:hypothetical protein
VSRYVRFRALSRPISTLHGRPLLTLSGLSSSCPVSSLREENSIRTLSSKYPVEDLAEGIVSGHPDMPIFVFNPHDVEAIIQYLQSIQIKQP